MYAQQQQPLATGGRLPPQPEQQSSLGWDLQQRMGNSAIQELMQQRSGAGGEMGIQRFEGIGESTDETARGGEIPGLPQVPGNRMLYGDAAIDDYSLKVEAGLLKGKDGIDLLNYEGQSGFWYDEEGNWNLGARSSLVGCEGGYDFWGDQGEDDGYLRMDGSLGDAEAAWRIGADGVEGNLGASAVSLGVSAGTGHHADSGWDAGIGIGLSGGAVGGGGGITMSDVDGDGVSELNLDGGLDCLFGAGVHVESEALGWAVDQASDFLFGGE